MIETPYLFFALLMIPTRYFVIAGFFYFLFYYIKKEGWIHLKIQKEIPSSSLIKTEIFYSFITMIIFSFVALLIFELYWANYTLIYLDLNKQVYDDLLNLGINKKNIFLSEICTFENIDYHNYF